MGMELDDLIFSDFGIKIFKRMDRYFIEYDAGDIVVSMRNVEITEAEAEKAMRSEKDAYDILIGK